MPNNTAPNPKEDLSIIIFTLIIGFLLLILTLFPNIGEGGEVPQDLAVRAIIGESSNQGYDGMLAVACGIRNRGHLNGVYGVKASHVDKEPRWVWKLAKKAWIESKSNRIHEGDHWENIKAFGRPYWVASMAEVYRYKDHVFYKGVQ